MHQKFDVVYENGVLRPLGPLPEQIREHQRYTVSVEGLGQAARPDAECPAAASLEEVRKILSKVSESLADAVAADREER